MAIKPRALQIVYNLAYLMPLYYISNTSVYEKFYLTHASHHCADNTTC